MMTRLSVKCAVQVKDSVVRKIDDEMQKAATSKAGTPIDVGSGHADDTTDPTANTNRNNEADSSPEGEVQESDDAIQTEIEKGSIEATEGKVEEPQLSHV